jgi:dTDP-4-amino-4,6-dideoxygalactose transaminase
MSNEKTPVKDGVRGRDYPWAKWPQVNESDVQAVADVVRSGKWSSNSGEEVHQFENEFAAYNKVKHAICVNSGNAALQIALSALGIRAGDEVILPDYTYIATATAVLMNGAVPVLVDIDPQTYNIDPAAVRRAITPRTKAIIPVHFSGSVCAMDELMQIAQENNLVIVEDAAHSHGGTWKNKALGTIGDMGCFSFQASKNLNCGEGGCIVTNNDDVAQICRAIASNGRVPRGIWYEHFINGSTFRMTEMQGALLRSQLTRLKDQTALRDANGRYLDHHWTYFEGISPMLRDPDQELHPYHLYMFRYDESTFGLPKSTFVERLQAEGIPANPGYGMPLHQQPLFSGENIPPLFATHAAPHRDAYNYKQTHAPVTEKACASEAVWIPQFVLLTGQEDLDDVLDTIRKIQKQA